MRVAIACLAAYLLAGVVWFLAAGGPRRAARSWSDAPPDLVEAAVLLAALVAIWPADAWLAARRRARLLLTRRLTLLDLWHV